MITADLIAKSPEDVGVDADRLERLFAEVRAHIEAGRLPSAQIAVARRGRVAGIATFGAAEQGGRVRPATNETLYCVYSTTKGVLAAALWILLEEGALDIDERVADVVPEFGANGKEVVTIRQLVTHTCGFPYAPLRPDVWDDRDRRLEAFSRWRLTWEPGSRFEYHPTAAHWVIAEVVERLAGQPFQRFIRDRVLAPMRLGGLHVGLPPELDSRVATVVQTVPPVEPPGGWGGASPDDLLVFNRPAARRVGVPGGGAIAGAAELALLYQPLINEGFTADGRRVLRAGTIERATQVLTDGRHVDPVMRVPVNRALGVVVAGDDGKAKFRGFGTATSPRAFGHGGAGGQIAWGDPESGISIGFCTNGLGPWIETGRRSAALSTLAAQCATGPR